MLVTLLLVTVVAQAAASTSVRIGAPPPPPPAPTPEGYIVTAAFHCDDFLCPDWELDVSRETTQYNFHETVNLTMLMPKSPEAEMDFPVATAYDNTTRQFYVAGCPDTGSLILWTTVLDANVSTAAIVSRVTYDFDPDDFLSRIHAGANGVVWAVFEGGDVVNVDPKTGKVRRSHCPEIREKREPLSCWWLMYCCVDPISHAHVSPLQGTLLTNILTNDPGLKDAEVTSASVIDPASDHLYAITLSDTSVCRHFLCVYGLC